MTIYPGASPKVIETTVTKAIEDAVSSLDKVKNVYGTSSDSVSVVSIEFTQSADVNFALQDAQRKVGEIAANLPEGARSPVITKFALDELPIIRLGTTSNLPSVDFYQFLKIMSNLPGESGRVARLLRGRRQTGNSRQCGHAKTPFLRPSFIVSHPGHNRFQSRLSHGAIKDRDGQYIVHSGKFQPSKSCAA
jgi:HAE1 family hydrophobic/amphiphilic exporter-1